MQGRILLLIYLLLPLCVHPTLSQNQLPYTQTKVESLIACFKLDAAERLLPKLEHTGLESFYNANIQIYKYLGTQNPAFLEKLNNSWENYVNGIEQMADTDTLKEVLLSDLYCKRAVIAFLNHQYLAAVKYTRTGRKLIQTHRKKYGNHILQMKIRGLFNVLLGSIPAKYKWISNTLGYYGDIQRGVSQLEQASRQSTLLRMEAFLISCFVEKNMLNRSERALSRLLRMRKRVGANMVLDFVLAAGYMHDKQNEAAISILSQRNQYDKAGIFAIPYWDYLLGKAFYFQENHTKAHLHLSQFLGTHRGKLFRNDAYFRLGMSLTLDDKYRQGRAYFELIAHATEGMDEDEYASYMARKFASVEPGPHTLNIFRARNLYDGGYFNRAISILKNLEVMPDLPPHLRIELHYRLGRVYHATEKFDQALSRYESCVSFSPEKEYLYLKVYALYYKGEILRKSGDLENARKAFDEALKADDYFYQNGLQNRCKIALDEVKREIRAQSSANNR